MEKAHFTRRCNTISLVWSVYETWENVAIDAIITKVFIKLGKITYLINKGDGRNDLAEIKRGKVNVDMKFDFKTRNVKLEAVAALLTLKKCDDNKIFMTI